MRHGWEKGKPSEWGENRLKAVRRFYSERLLQNPQDEKALREIPYLTWLIRKRKRQRAAKQLNANTRKSIAHQSRLKSSKSVVVNEPPSKVDPACNPAVDTAAIRQESGFGVVADAEELPRLVRRVVLSSDDSSAPEPES